MSQEVSDWLLVYNLRINRVNWGYNPLTNLLLTSWDFQVFCWVAVESRPIRCAFAACAAGIFFKEKLHPTRFHKPHWIIGQVDDSGTAIKIAYMGDRYVYLSNIDMRTLKK